MPQIWNPTVVKDWFAEHVCLQDRPYTLDDDQAKAVCDQHTNTLVVARAGSGKTRVIVAKAVFLVKCCGYTWDEILIFMFNRTAAAEVNQRLAEVTIDQHPIATKPLRVASTFHKFALDVLKGSGQTPNIISPDQQSSYVLRAFEQALGHRRLNPTARTEAFRLTQSFITRAGQSYPLQADLPRLKQRLESLLPTATKPQAFYQKLGFIAYAHYLAQFRPPQIDFNQLLAAATDELARQANLSTPSSALPIATSTSTSIPAPFDASVESPEGHPITSFAKPLRYLMIDEYQDFSRPFFRLIQALRALYSELKLFAVGDDWQAINRFAGSDVKYFIDFAKYFPEDTTTIPLLANYRSRHKIVDNANRFMLTHYDPEALPAKAHQRRAGHIHTLHPDKLRFNTTDIQEDGLNDGRFGKLLPENLSPKQQKAAGRLVKQLYILIKRHSTANFLILHRHNFTTFPGLDLTRLQHTLAQLLSREHVLSPETYRSQVHFLTIHKSKGLEADIVILLEFNRDLLLAPHPHGSLFTVFGDNRTQEAADQARLLYVALTRAKERLYLLTNDQRSLLARPKNPLPKSP